MNGEKQKQAKRLGAQIKTLRLSRNESQTEFGENFSPVAARGVVSRWESGKRVPRAKRLAKIAEMSGKTVTELLNGTTSNVISQTAEELPKTETLPKLNFPRATITGMNGKQFTEYLTPFKDDAGDNVTFVYDTDVKTYTDDAYCMFELTNAGIDDDYQHRIMQKVADEYGCEFNNDELLSNDSTVLLQAMLAVYAWLKLKEMD